MAKELIVHKADFLHSSHPRHNKARFLVGVTIVALAFLVALATVLLSKYRPSADTGTGGTTVLPQATLIYTDPSTGQSVYTHSNAFTFTLAPAPSILVSLQGLNRANTGSATYAGTLNVISGIKQLLASPLTWNTSGFYDDTHQKADLYSQSLYNVVDGVRPGASVRFVVKPNNYLAVDATTNNFSLPVTLPEAATGDINNDNVINNGDFDTWKSHFGQQTTPATQNLDFNHDGTIDEADFAMAFADNFNKTGAH